MNQRLLTIDSRDREDTANEDKTRIRVMFEGGISFKSISLIFMDLPIDGDENDDEAVYFITIEELPQKVRGSKNSDKSTFVQVRSSDVGGRSLAFENNSFNQIITLPHEQTFTEFNIIIRYRLKTAETLKLVSDYSCIFKISD
jgi:hypothetical protein